MKNSTTPMRKTAASLSRGSLARLRPFSRRWVFVATAIVGVRRGRPLCTFRRNDGISDEPKPKWWSLTPQGVCVIAIVLAAGIGLMVYVGRHLPRSLPELPCQLPKTRFQIRTLPGSGEWCRLLK